VKKGEKGGGERRREREGERKDQHLYSTTKVQ
jgi:hypothetical protein